MAESDARSEQVQPLPCPFCGHVGVSGYEGSTFRWWHVACDGCGAQCGEVRVQTIGIQREEAIQKATRDAVLEWNKRAPVSERLASGFSAEAVENVRGWIKANIDAEKDEGTPESVRLLEKIDAMLCERNTP